MCAHQRLKAACELKCQKTYLQTCVLIKDSEQPVSWNVRRHTFRHVCSSKTQSSLCIHAVWSKSLLSTSRNFASLAMQNTPSEDPDLGPVVQSIVSLTTSLRVISLTVSADPIYNILIFFAEKMWVAFALQKLLTFFQQKISEYLRVTRCKF